MTHPLTWWNRNHPPTVDASSLHTARLVQTKAREHIQINHRVSLCSTAPPPKKIYWGARLMQV